MTNTIANQQHTSPKFSETDYIQLGSELTQANEKLLALQNHITKLKDEETVQQQLVDDLTLKYNYLRIIKSKQALTKFNELKATSLDLVAKLTKIYGLHLMDKFCEQGNTIEGLLSFAKISPDDARNIYALRIEKIGRAFQDYLNNSDISQGSKLDSMKRLINVSANIAKDIYEKNKSAILALPLDDSDFLPESEDDIQNASSEVTLSE